MYGFKSSNSFCINRTSLGMLTEPDNRDRGSGGSAKRIKTAKYFINLTIIFWAKNAALTYGRTVLIEKHALQGWDDDRWQWTSHFVAAIQYMRPPSMADMIPEPTYSTIQYKKFRLCMYYLLYYVCRIRDGALICTQTNLWTSSAWCRCTPMSFGECFG